MEYKIKNCKWNNAEHTSLDCIWSHPALGDIPYTAVRTEMAGSAIIDAAIAQGGINEYIETEKTLEELKTSLKNSIAERRYTVETGGITLNGITVDTSLESQNRITAVIANASAAGVTEVDFKAESGWVHLTIIQVQQIAAAIGLHVQACYSAERAHDIAIDALEDVEAAHAYDVTVGWPSTTTETSST